MTTDTVPKQASYRRRGLVDRRDGQGRRDARARAGHHAGGDHHRRGASTRRRLRDQLARGVPDQLRPGGQRRLHVHQRHGDPDEQRGLRRRPDAGRLPGRAERGLHRSRPAADRRRRGRRARHRDHGRARAATEDDAVEVGRAIARSNLFKCAVFGARSQLGPGAGRHRHHRRRLRARPDRRRLQRRPGLPRRRRSAIRASSSTCAGREVASRSTCAPAAARRRSGPTTSPTTTSRRTRSTRHDATQPRSPLTPGREGVDPDRDAALAGDLRRQDRGDQVRRQRHDRRRPEARRSPRTSCS